MACDPQLVGLVLQLQVPDTELVRAAETRLAELKQAAPGALVTGLLVVARSAEDPTARHMAATLVRRCVVGSAAVYEQLPQDVAAAVRSALLELVVGTDLPAVRSMTASVVSELGEGLLPQGQWPDLIPFLSCSVSQEAPQPVRCAALEIFGSLAPDLVAAEASQLQPLGAMYQAALADADVVVRNSAAESLLLLVIAADTRTAKKLTPLLPPVIGCLSAALCQGDEDTANSLIQSLSLVAENTPQFYGSHTTAVAEAMYTAARNDGLSCSTRGLALEYLLTFAETSPKKASQAPGFTVNMVRLLTEWLSAPPFGKDADRLQQWAAARHDDDGGDDDDSSFWIAKDGLDRLATALGSGTVSPCVSQTVAELLAKGTWQHTYAALVTLSQTAEGCAEHMGSDLGSLVPRVLASCGHEHPLVRAAALECICQFCVDFAEHRPKFHDAVLRSLIGALSDSVPRLREFASQTVVSLYDGAPAGMCAGALRELLLALYSVVQQDEQPMPVKECAFAAVAAVADNAGAGFADFYDNFMPVISVALSVADLPPTASSSDRRDFRRFQAKAISCLSCMALVCGPGRFSRDAAAVCGHLCKLQATITEADDPRADELQVAWRRIAECLRGAFLPYLPHVLPSMLARAEAVEELRPLDDEEEADESAGQEEVANPRGGRAAVHTAALDDKAAACDNLRAVCVALGTDLPADAAERVASALLPLVLNNCRADIRSFAAEGVAALVDILRDLAAMGRAPPEASAKLLHHAVGNFADAIRIVATTEAMTAMLASVVQVCSADGFTEPLLMKLGAALVGALEASFKRSEDDEEEEETTSESDSDADSDVAGDSSEELTESSFRESIATAVRELIEQQPLFRGAPTAAWLNRLHDYLLSGVEMKREFALPALCDFVESGGDVGAKVLVDCGSAFLLFASRLEEEFDDTTQAAAYGLGLVSSKGVVNAEFAARASGALKLIVASGLSASCRVTAASALLKVMDTQQGLVKDQDVLPTIMQHLPYSGDRDEARIVHSRMVALLEAGHPCAREASSKICNLASLYPQQAVSVTEP
eukprot:TRINITY_DN1429_c0_g1_i2.p1 TRINITY_DN1429_c0_g1~~TRINITY_DN1429_c0_g1_i2.p1  ORF type:complete len:1057 (+),score=317.33 TRINITY_DN1429_c0_g1_i2:64-3234(+)